MQFPTQFDFVVRSIMKRLTNVNFEVESFVFLHIPFWLYFVFADGWQIYTVQVTTRPAETVGREDHGRTFQVERLVFKGLGLLLDS